MWLQSARGDYMRGAYMNHVTEKNVQGGFAGAGLIPYDPERVISKLDV